MHGLSVLHLTSVTGLRSRAESWDDLWRRSEVTHPTARAELIAQWFDQFSRDTRFDALVVRQGDRFLAALPLVTRHKRRLLRCLDIPGNEWSSAGQFLLDPRCDSTTVCDTLVRHFQELAGSLFWFASIPIQASWWHAFRAATERAGLEQDVRPRYEVGRLPVERTWSAQQEQWSKNFRRQLRRATWQLRKMGDLRLRVERPNEIDRAQCLLNEGLRLEDNGWKGNARSSVLASAGMEAFVKRQAKQLCEWRQLVLSFLEHRGRVIAFEYGWLAKRVYHSYKVSYDERLRQFSPGQVLVGELLKHFQSVQECDEIDFLGPIDQAVERWHPIRYPIGRLIVAPRGLPGRGLVFAARHMLPPTGGEFGQGASGSVPVYPFTSIDT